MKKNIYKYNFKSKIKTNTFSIKQQQLRLEAYFYNQFERHVVPYGVTYTAKYIEAKNFNPSLPLLLICIKDNSELLTITLNNLQTYDIDSLSNILVIDDRPSNELNKQIVLDQGYSYISVKNSSNIFNFSMLHNMAVHVVRRKYSTISKIILWNSDLWTKDKDTLPELLRLHDESNSAITGTKLIYPDKTFKYYEESKANTVQFAGALFGGREDMDGLFPFHIYRGYPPEDEKVNCNKGELFITGAFMIINFSWFIKSGGFNPTLAIINQDTDLCLRAISQNKKVLYFGKDLQFYHYEGMLRGEADCNLDQPKAESLIFSNLWPANIMKKILFKFE